MYEHCIANGLDIPGYIQDEIDYLTMALEGNNLARWFHKVGVLSIEK